MPIVRKLGARLFLEGIELPLVHVNVVTRVMGHATASFSIPASDMVHELLPRTLVHIFYYDNYKGLIQVGDSAEELYARRGTPPDANVQARAKGSLGHTIEGIDSTNPYNWHLLFAGEIASYKYAKDQGQRLVSFTAFSFTSYWDDAKLYFGGLKDQSSKNYKQAMFLGAAQAVSGKKTIDSSKKLIDVMKAVPKTPGFTTVPGLLGGCVSLLESVMGVYEHKKVRRRRKKKRQGGKDIPTEKPLKIVRGITDYLCQAELRLKTIKQLGINPNDKSSKKLLGDTFERQVKSIGKRMRATASYGQLLRVLLDRTFHIYTPVLCPPYIPEGKIITAKRKVSLGRRKISKEAKTVFEEVAQQSEKMNESYRARTTKKEYTEGVDTEGIGDKLKNKRKPGAINAKDPVEQYSEIEAWSANNKSGKAHAVPTTAEINALSERISALESEDRSPPKKKGSKKGGKKGRKPTSGEKGRLEQMSQKLKAARKLFDKLEEVKSVPGTGESIGETPEGKPVKDVGERPDSHPGHNEETFEELRLTLLALGATKKRYLAPRYKIKDVEVKATDRLYTVLMNPMIWMCPPPKCNVVFPNMYSTMSFSRDFRGECTRFWLYGLKGARGRPNLQQSYFAPNVQVLGGKPKFRDVASAAKNSKSFLLPHERFSGIVAGMEGIGDVELLGIPNKMTEDEEYGIHKGGRSIFTQVVNTKSGKKVKKSIFGFQGKNPALARAASTKFFNARYSSRTASVSGPFNPGLIAGLPALILDPYIESDDLVKRVKVRKSLAEIHEKDPKDVDLGVKGTHYLGYITSITHQISQGGARTSFTMAYTRAHNEGLEVFGSDRATVTMDKRIRAVKRRGRIKSKSTIWAEVHDFKYKLIKGKDGKITKVWDPVIGADGVKGSSGTHVTKMLIQQKLSVTKKVSAEGVLYHAESHEYSGVANPILPAGPGAGASFAPEQEGGTSRPTTTPTIAIDPTDSRPGIPRRELRAAFPGEVDTADLEVTSVEPVRFKGADTAFDRNLSPEEQKARDDAVPLETGFNGGDIPQDNFQLSGHKYSKTKSWMSKEAKGAIQVDAFKRGPKRTIPAKNFNITFSFEQIARPPWFDASYLNQNIGSEFYLELLGCGALTDEGLVATDSYEGDLKNILQVKSGLSKPLSTYVTDDDWKLMMTGVDSENLASTREVIQKYVTSGDYDDTIKVSLVDGGHIELPVEAIGGVTIQESIEKLAYVYSRLAYDTDTYSRESVLRFTEEFTRRSFAPMPAIFGFSWKSGEVQDVDPKAGSNEKPGDINRPEGLSSTELGVVGTRYVVPLPEYEDFNYFGEDVRGDGATEGFHSYAFGEVDNLALLPYCPPFEELGGGSSKARDLNSNVDPRKERYIRVMLYRNAIHKKVIKG